MERLTTSRYPFSDPNTHHIFVNNSSPEVDAHSIDDPILDTTYPTILYLRGW